MVTEIVLADATEGDRLRLLEIFTDVVERGDGYPELAPLGPDRFAASWVDLVFESNPARSLYEHLGWREIGRVPRAVGDESAVIYWRDV